MTRAAAGRQQFPTRRHSLVQKDWAPDPFNGTCEPEQAAQTRWEMWFPARLGPPRKKSKTISGVKVSARVRSMELPPTKNTKHGNPYSHAKWIKEWRETADQLAKDMGIPPCQRISISAVVYRRTIGVADAENDHARLAPLQDGLVDAGVVPDDTYKFVERGQVVEARAGKRGAGILLIVERLEPAAREGE